MQANITTYGNFFSLRTLLPCLQDILNPSPTSRLLFQGAQTLGECQQKGLIVSTSQLFKSDFTE